MKEPRFREGRVLIYLRLHSREEAPWPGFTMKRKGAVFEFR